MSRSERDKGAAGELEAAAIFRARGFDCDRTPNSGGLRIRGDLVGTVPCHLEVKRQETARVWDWYAQAVAEAPAGELPVVAFRRNRSPWLGLLALEPLADLFAAGARLLELERPVLALEELGELERREAALALSFEAIRGSAGAAWHRAGATISDYMAGAAGGRLDRNESRSGYAAPATELAAMVLALLAERRRLLAELAELELAPAAAEAVS